MNVEELLIDKDIKFVPKGADYLVSCLNPEHEDRNPSMRIDSVTGIYQCFSCEFKGNLFTHFGEIPNFLQMKRDLLKKRIRETRAESIGLTLPKGATPYTGDWRGISKETYAHFGAFQHHDPEFVGRLVFPIKDISGRTVSFLGRHMSNGTPKYKFDPVGVKVPMYPTVKPLKGSVIIVEGIYDAMNLYDKGLENAVCVFGTKNITETKLSRLAMQGAQNIDIFMDGDDAGQSAAEKIKHMCENVKLLTRNVFIEGTDPGALTQAQVTKLKRKLYG